MKSLFTKRNWSVLLGAMIVALGIQPFLGHFPGQATLSLTSGRQANLFENFVHVDNLHIGSFAGQDKFYLTNTQGVSQLVIFNDIENRGAINFKLNCDHDYYLGHKGLSSVIAKRSWPREGVNHYQFQLEPRD